MQERGDCGVVTLNKFASNRPAIQSVDSSLNVMAHGDAGRGSEGETGEWSG
jgi:hypothetical protein